LTFNSQSASISGKLQQSFFKSEAQEVGLIFQNEWPEVGEKEDNYILTLSSNAASAADMARLILLAMLMEV